MSITEGSRHELTCTACGAPLENTVLMEAKPAAAPLAPVATTPRRIESDKSDKKRSSKYKSKKEKSDKEKSVKKRRKKKRRGLGYWIREAIDEIEDLFD